MLRRNENHTIWGLLQVQAQQGGRRGEGVCFRYLLSRVEGGGRGSASGTGTAGWEDSDNIIPSFSLSGKTPIKEVS